MGRQLDDGAIRQELEALSGDWSYDGHSISLDKQVGDFKTGLRLIQEIGVAAETSGHHPDLALRDYDRLTITSSTHDAGGVTGRDLALAKKIDMILSGKEQS